MSFLYDAQDPKPGIYDGVPISLYHSSAGFSSTGLHTCISRSPAHYKWEKDNPVHHDYFDVGNAVHVALLEPDSWGDRVVEIEHPDYRTRRAQDERDRARELYPNRYVLHEGQADEVRAMAHSVETSAERFGLRPDPYALLQAGGIEQTYVTQDPVTGLVKRARPDVVIRDHRMIVDLKTGFTAEPRAFGKKRRDLGYHLSAAFHLDVTCEALGEDPADWTYLWVVVEKEPPYVVGTFRASPALLAAGRNDYARALELVAACERTGIYSPYSTRIETLEPSQWEREALPRETA